VDLSVLYLQVLLGGTQVPSPQGPAPPFSWPSVTLRPNKEKDHDLSSLISTYQHFVIIIIKIISVFKIHRELLREELVLGSFGNAWPSPRLLGILPPGPVPLSA
jgi:hypothetical protein